MRELLSFDPFFVHRRHRAPLRRGTKKKSFTVEHTHMDDDILVELLTNRVDHHNAQDYRANTMVAELLRYRGEDPILFYSWSQCGHCKAARKILRKQIDAGTVKVLPHTKAPAHVRAFPYFKWKSHTHTGGISSYKQLCTLLRKPS